jgi:hypothetical protein
MAPDHIAAIIRLFDSLIEPLLHSGPFDFGNRTFLRSLRDRGFEIASDRANWRMPPVELLFVQRKLGGTYHLAARLKARVDIRRLLQAYL